MQRHPFPGGYQKCAQSSHKLRGLKSQIKSTDVSICLLTVAKGPEVVVNV